MHLGKAQIKFGFSLDFHYLCPRESDDDTADGTSDAFIGDGSGRDWRPRVCTYSEGGQDAGGRRLHTVYGAVERLCVPRTDVQEQAPAAGLYPIGEEREEGAATGQTGTTDYHRNSRVHRDPAPRGAQGTSEEGGTVYREGV